jgi:hypothetical protein
MKKLIPIAVLSFAAEAAEIYYEDGSYVNVPDGWVSIQPDGRLNCQDIPDDPRCGQGYVEWEHVPPTYVVNPTKYLKQGAFDVTSGSR